MLGRGTDVRLATPLVPSRAVVSIKRYAAWVPETWLIREMVLRTARLLVLVSMVSPRVL